MVGLGILVRFFEEPKGGLLSMSQFGGESVVWGSLAWPNGVLRKSSWTLIVFNKKKHGRDTQH